ncbi:MAG: DoxX family protein [Chitinophagales bacterium]|nr:DoxX family protein [Chitinophagales bacterium]
MSEKTTKIIHWILTGLVAFVFLGSAYGKLAADATALEMAKGFGLDATTFKMLGIVEILSVLLFIIPRTGILGTLLLVAYMGGAIATHLEHQQSPIAPMAIAAFVWVVAVIRFPELRGRLFGKTL